MNSNNKVHELIDRRWSPRAFDSRKVEQDKLLRVLEAARRAPSCSNEQPWRILIGVKGEGDSYGKIYSVMDDFNVLWTKTAPVLGLMVSKINFSHNNAYNRHHFYDCGQALAYLTFQATAEGLFVHQMAGFDPEKAKDIFSIPEGYEVITAFTIGYEGDPAILPESIRKKEYKKVIRKELGEIAFTEWGTPLF